MSRRTKINYGTRGKVYSDVIICDQCKKEESEMNRTSQWRTMARFGNYFDFCSDACEDKFKARFKSVLKR